LGNRHQLVVIWRYKTGEGGVAVVGGATAARFSGVVGEKLIFAHPRDINEQKVDYL